MGTLEWVDDARAVAQEQVSDPIAAIGFLQPAGSWGALGVSYVSGAGGTVAQQSANKRASGLAKAGGFNDEPLAELGRAT